MKKPGWKDYFRFSRKERYGAFGLSLLVGILMLSPRIFQDKTLSGSELEYLEAKTIEINERDNWQKPAGERSEFIPGETGTTAAATLFYFDPNEIKLQDWVDLGIRESTARTIEKFKAKGGRFRKVEDLRKIYGLREEEFKRLLPYVRISKTQKRFEWKGRQTAFVSESPDSRTSPTTKNSDNPELKNRSSPTNYSVSSFTGYTKKEVAKIEINQADSADFDQLPGIGPTLSRRILNFRGSLGGFISTSQIREVYGISDTLFEKLAPYLSCSSVQLTLIDINNAEYATLKNHPYIRGALARQLLNYRRQHGAFSKAEALLALEGTDEQWLEKIKPYLKF